MHTYLADRALLTHGWAEDVLIEVEPEGNISGVTPGAAGTGGAERLRGHVLPGMVDLHSHAFQRGLAGLAQRLPPAGEASFWGWREEMYAFASRLGPEVAAVAAQLFVELLKGGYTSVVEFHYLHNQADGSPYADRAAMALALHEAALEAGIALTLLPTVYLQAGVGGEPLEGPQRRFALDPDGWGRLAGALEAAFRDDPQRRLGLALHSVRAVPGEAIRAAVAAAKARRGPAASALPIHAHLAEQPREVRECLDRHGHRPLALLREAAEVDGAWCLVHGTHLVPDELREVARAGATVGLCPTTEADLGDGVFPLADHLAAGGGFGVGSDANVATDAAGELRLLEWGQRLAHLRRTVAATADQPHTGRALWGGALLGGAKAAGRPAGRLAPGFRADLVVLDPDHPSLAGRAGDRALDGFLFAPGSPVRDVMVGGAWRVRDGRHPAEAAVARAYRRAMGRAIPG
jgi:formimidoylglutamate deiminase